MIKQQCPENLQILLDADITRYEIGHAAETGWKAVTGSDGLPPFDFVETMLLKRLETIQYNLKTNKKPILYMTEGETFRSKIATQKPYKGTRSGKKPYHYENLTVYLRDVLGAKIVTGIEADDALSIDHTSNPETTILVSRDKDCRQVPGWFFSYELGRQPAFGPEWIYQAGYLTLTDKKLSGTGYSWFLAQCLIGDAVDNVPGCPGIGPVQAFEKLAGRCWEDQQYEVCQAYSAHYGASWLDYMEEQARLVWLLRHDDQLWELDTIE